MQAITEQDARTTNVLNLIIPEDFEGVVATVLDNNDGMEREVAERIVREALKYVHACAIGSHRGLRPSRVVDEGWHALILHTLVYNRLCHQLGRYVHHVPERPDTARHDPSELNRTMAAITEAGYDVDVRLWLPPADESIPVAADCEHGPSKCAACFDGGPN